MSTVDPSSASLLTVGVASRAMPGQQASGDLHVVCEFPKGALVAALDGLGHGHDAAVAAAAAAALLAGHASESVIALTRRCHQELARTRGVVMSLASFSATDATMTWLGTGNVEGALLRADPTARPAQESLLLRGGVVGYQLPSLYASVIALAPGDTLIFATDGIWAGFADRLALSEPPEAIAARILAQHWKGTDDALVVVARFEGGRSP